MEEMIGVIKLFAGNFPPRGWAYCDGTLLAISSNDALFSILGTTYGGDGRTTFALPDLRGRTPIGTGTGPGFSTITLGGKGGIEFTTLTTSNMPNHSHVFNVSSNPGTTNNPTGSFVAQSTVVLERGGSPVPSPGFLDSSNSQLASSTISPVGGSQQVSLRNPYQATNYIICLYGIYPSRN
ncbi:phage tail protein [Algoriphagus yeomjeoni]|uniref:Microcystin-dependent protein n=1 Tax=Algoriphagus yeomjeoni TaxID=291403 RepID=A0A327P7X7_9BACT|nr:tail fiber protein [Algoriphagus yeomjeoni]RAI88308.1 microcystin-dependent protein [Algoriphagus yeomjeoni]